MPPFLVSLSAARQSRVKCPLQANLIPVVFRSGGYNVTNYDSLRNGNLILRLAGYTACGFLLKTKSIKKPIVKQQRLADDDSSLRPRRRAQGWVNYPSSELDERAWMWSKQLDK